MTTAHDAQDRKPYYKMDFVFSDILLDQWFFWWV